jgi:nucleoside diphosphate kinase
MQNCVQRCRNVAATSEIVARNVAENIARYTSRELVGDTSRKEAAVKSTLRLKFEFHKGEKQHVLC